MTSVAPLLFISWYLIGTGAYIVAEGHSTFQVDWGLSVDGLLLGPSAPGRFAPFKPMMGKVHSLGLHGLLE